MLQAFWRACVLYRGSCMLLVCWRCGARGRVAAESHRWASTACPHTGMDVAASVLRSQVWVGLCRLTISRPNAAGLLILSASVQFAGWVSCAAFWQGWHVRALAVFIAVTYLVGSPYFAADGCCLSANTTQSSKSLLCCWPTSFPAACSAHTQS
jgi:ribosomal protein L40E